MRCPFSFSFAADKRLPKLFMEPCHGKISDVKRSSILLKLLLLLNKVLTHLDISSELSKHGNLTLFCHYHCLPWSSSIKNGPMVLCFKKAIYAVHFLMQNQWGFSLPQITKFLELIWAFKRKWTSSENQTSFKNSSSSSIFCENSWHMTSIFSISAWFNWRLIWIQ